MIEVYGAGHGSNTPGKCSPDGKFKEYSYAREIVRAIVAKRKAEGYNAVELVPEEYDVSLAERCRRVNALCDKHGKQNVIYISVHVNAAGGDGKWKTAGGWSVWTSPGKTQADVLANHLWYAAQTALTPYANRFPVLKERGAYDRKQVPMRADWSDGDPDYEARFYVLIHSKCPAVLTESLFQDNKADVDFLTSSEGKRAIVNLHCNGVQSYLNSLKKR